MGIKQKSELIFLNIIKLFRKILLFLAFWDTDFTERKRTVKEVHRRTKKENV